ncbi:MAG: TorF family putative porin [Burkholderiales bacterium]|nr:TorF family putative porin [Burkholderiales bacterium]
MFKQKVLAATLAGVGLTAVAAHAQDTSPHSVSGNITFVTNYMTRGLTQTDSRPALQGGVDYAHSSGLYASFWGSNVSWPADGFEVAAPGISSAYGGSPSNAISNSLELDFSAGYRKSFLTDFTVDVGGVYYYYPGTYILDRTYTAGLKTPQTAEVYAGLGWKWFTAKAWVAVSDGVFMVPDARGTTYYNLSGTFPLGESGFNIVAAVGTWQFQGQAEYLQTYGLKNDIYDLVDYKIGLTKEILGFNVGAFYWGSNGDKTTVGAPGSANAGFETAVWGNRYGRNIADDTFLVSIGKSF